MIDNKERRTVLDIPEFQEFQTIPTNLEKRPLIKFKGVNTPTLAERIEDGDKTPNLAFRLPRPYIVVDVDDMDTAKVLLRIVRAVETTKDTIVVQSRKGLHFYFKSKGQLKHDTKVALPLPLGDSIDIKPGNPSKTVMCHAKLAGKWRTVVSGTKICDLPFWLVPLNLGEKVKVPDLRGQPKGGRDNAFTRLVPLLNSWNQTNMTPFDVSFVLKIVNRFLYATPMTEKEMEKWSPIPLAKRLNTLNKNKPKIKSPWDLIKIHEKSNYYYDEKENKFYVYGEEKKLGWGYWPIGAGKVPSALLAKVFFDKYHIKVFGKSGLTDMYLYNKDKGRYQANVSGYIEGTIKSMWVELRNTKVKEVVEDISWYASSSGKIVDMSEYPSNQMYFRNGVYSLVTRTLRPYKEREFYPIQINYNFYPKDDPHHSEATKQKVFKILDSFANSNKNTAFEIVFVVGCTVLTMAVKHFFVFYGGTNTGKSSLISVLQKIAGEHWTNIRTQNAKKDKFETSVIHNKILLIDNEMTDTYTTDSTLAKEITGGDTIKIEAKYQHPMVIRNMATLISTTNHLPNYSDKGKAMQERLVVIHFTKDQTALSSNAKEWTSFLEDRKAIEFFIALGVHAIEVSYAKFDGLIRLDKSIEQEQRIKDVMFGNDNLGIKLSKTKFFEKDIAYNKDWSIHALQDFFNVERMGLRLLVSRLTHLIDSIYYKTVSYRTWTEDSVTMFKFERRIQR